MSSEKAFGVLTKSIEVVPFKDGKVEVEIEDVSEKEGHVIKFYSRSKKEFVMREIKEPGNTVFVLTLIGENPSLVALKVIRYLSVMKSEMLWASGVCSLPDEFIEKYKDKHDLEEGDCSWEAIIGVPTDVSQEAIKEEIRKIDDKNAIKDVIFEIVKKRS